MTTELKNTARNAQLPSSVAVPVPSLSAQTQAATVPTTSFSGTSLIIAPTGTSTIIALVGTTIRR